MEDNVDGQVAEIVDGYESRRQGVFVKQRNTDPLVYASALISPTKTAMRAGVFIIRGVNGISLIEDMKRYIGSRASRALYGEYSSKQQIAFVEWFAFEFVNLMDDMIEGYNSLEPDNIPLSRLVSIREAAKNDTYLSRVELDHPPILSTRVIKKSMKGKPWKHQIEFLAYFNKVVPAYGLRGTILATPPGTGKTYSALFLAESLKATKVIIIAPKVAITSVWVNEINDLYKKQQKIVSVFDRRLPTVDDRFLVYNYEQVDKVREVVNEFKGEKVLIVVDESHNANTDEALRTVKIKDLATSMADAYTVLLSGTPIKALPIEVLPLLTVIDPLFTDKARLSFIRAHKDREVDRGGMIKNRLGLVSFKVDKAVLELQEPKHVYHYLKLENPEVFLIENVKQEMTAYVHKRLKELRGRSTEFEDEWSTLLAGIEDKLMPSDLRRYRANVKRIQQIAVFFQHGDLLRETKDYEQHVIRPLLSPEGRKTFDRVAPRVKYPQLVAIGESLGRVLGRRRIECNSALAALFDFSTVIENTTKKTLVFSNSIDVLNSAEEAMKKSYTPLRITSDNSSNLDMMVSSFKTDRLNPALSTYQLLATAVNMTMCDRTIFLDMPNRAHVLDQAQSRTWRSGATTEVQFHYVLLDTEEPNVSTRTRDILQWSADQIREMTEVIVGDTGEDPGGMILKYINDVPFSVNWK